MATGTTRSDSIYNVDSMEKLLNSWIIYPQKVCKTIILNIYVLILCKCMAANCFYSPLTCCIIIPELSLFQVKLKIQVYKSFQLGKSPQKFTKESFSNEKVAKLGNSSQVMMTPLPPKHREFFQLRKGKGIIKNKNSQVSYQETILKSKEEEGMNPFPKFL